MSHSPDTIAAEMDRRQLIKMTATYTAGAILLGTGDHVMAADMTSKTLSLDGLWKVAQLKNPSIQENASLQWIDAEVPHAVQYALIKAGIIQNVFESAANAEAAVWVANSDWLYQKQFDLPKDVLAFPNVVLQLNSIDTFADAYVNDTLIGSTDNMFVRYQFDLTSAKMRASGNVLQVHVKGHERMLTPLQERIKSKDPQKAIKTKGQIRRYQRSFNPDTIGFTKAVLGIGISGSVEILARPASYVGDFHFMVKRVEDAKADIQISLEISGHTLVNRAEVILSDDEGNEAAKASQSVTGSTMELPLAVDKPKLWWPVGYGKQSMYTLTMNLFDDKGTVYTQQKKVGIKQAKIVTKKPDGRECFELIVNGKEIYCRGGNLMPLDALTAFGKEADYDRMLSLAVHANMNMIRLWGGGINEPERFLELCDAKGIMIFKDFHFHSTPYPDFDEQYVASVTKESEVTVKYHRNHPCFTIICGGNEQQEGWDAWSWKESFDTLPGGKLMYGVLPDVAKKHCPEIPYIPNSPYGKKLSQSPVDGDTHTWGNFYNATEDPQFVTETCWNVASYSRPETLKEVMHLDVEEYKGKNWYGKWRKTTGLKIESKNQFSEYHQTESLREYLLYLEVEQLFADYHALYLLRCRSSSCSGILYWPLNKGGPLFNYGCIDYGARPLMPYYLLSRLFQDVVVHIYRDIDDLRVVVSNLGNEAIQGNLVITHVTTNSDQVSRHSVPITVPKARTARIYELPGAYAKAKDRWNECIHVSLESGGTVLSKDLIYFCPVSEVETKPATLTCSVRAVNERSWSVTVTSNAFVKLLVLECPRNCVLSDNYFPLLANETVQLTVTKLYDDASERQTVTVRSLDGNDQQSLSLT